LQTASYHLPHAVIDYIEKTAYSLSNVVQADAKKQ